MHCSLTSTPHKDLYFLIFFIRPPQPHPKSRICLFVNSFLNSSYLLRSSFMIIFVLIYPEVVLFFIFAFPILNSS